ncbi:YafY family protein [Anaeromyxobacter sp. SG66]|uniref:helix-turn-helix transcriptional regulator n=1 Tax=Anaeromyxobacter sp. SG66 TaxID=2925410 RepID=UPI001F592443|nr:WYL domain-containing protein [Anaeromyxobacter sp. SG66]
MKRAVQGTNAAAPVPVLLTVARGIRHSRRVRILYRDAGGATTARDVEVRGVSFQDGWWYALVHCRLRRAERLFRLDRVLDARVTTRPARPPPTYGFDAAFFASVEYLTPGAPVAHLASIRLTAPLASAATAIFPGAIAERSGRTVTCHVRVSRPEVLSDLVKTLGPEAEWVHASLPPAAWP